MEPFFTWAVRGVLKIGFLVLFLYAVYVGREWIHERFSPARQPAPAMPGTLLPASAGIEITVTEEKSCSEICLDS